MSREMVGSPGSWLVLGALTFSSSERRHLPSFTTTSPVSCKPKSNLSSLAPQRTCRPWREGAGASAFCPPHWPSFFRSPCFLSSTLAFLLSQPLDPAAWPGRLWAAQGTVLCREGFWFLTSLSGFGSSPLGSCKCWALRCASGQPLPMTSTHGVSPATSCTCQSRPVLRRAETAAPSKSPVCGFSHRRDGRSSSPWCHLGLDRRILVGSLWL